MNASRTMTTLFGCLLIAAGLHMAGVVTVDWLREVGRLSASSGWRDCAWCAAGAVLPVVAAAEMLCGALLIAGARTATR